MSGNEESASHGKIGEVIHTKQPDGRIFERYRRPPGTRLVIISPDKKILITREHRQENDKIDLRLPGGKVVDSLPEFHKLLDEKADMVEEAIRGAKKEAVEETGLIVNDLKLLTIARAGATVEWDLYYFEVRNFGEHPDGQQLEHGEDVEVTWMGAQELKDAIERGEMHEWRSVGVLLGLVLPKL
ncbi:hypothetical protein A3F37_04340 [Candidatus Saccharibacteria bacterium RIFCSPHIGHO2_12_FULL_41_12]|nr:MAG: hypothetical protein A3F37_04340 [Candidatus Saccharibacteria bacterium RIFCSPHIGHO2_12_FULL_41_12]